MKMEYNNIRNRKNKLLTQAVAKIFIEKFEEKNCINFGFLLMFIQ